MRTRLHLGITLAALGMWPVACNCDDDLNQVPGVIKGQFCEPESGQGLPKAAISVMKADGSPTDLKSVETDLDGLFEIKDVNPGTYKVIGVLGSVVREREVVVKSDETTEFTDEGCHEPPKPPGGAVRGRVCDASKGTWVAFANAWLSSRGNRGDILYQGATNAEGVYLFEGVLPKAYDVHVELEDFAFDYEDVPVADGRITEVPSPDRCDPPPGGAIEGRICETNVGWMQGARVYVNVAGGNVIETTTDVDGRFRLENVPPGDQVVHAEKGPYNQSWTVPVTSAATSQIPNIPDTCEPPPSGGTVTGRVCSPDGSTWLNQAHVFIGDETTPVTDTYTDPEGRFTLQNVPAGQQVVKVVKGSFSTEHQVPMTPGGTYNIPEDQCGIIPTATKVAVVNGQYDNVRCLLTGKTDPLSQRPPKHVCELDGLGLEPDNVVNYDGEQLSWAGGFLGNYAEMEKYDIIFFNCGLMDNTITTGATSTVYAANLRKYVENGGSVYASDWAASVIEAAFPEFIDWIYANGMNESVKEAKAGNTQAIIANVVDPGIQATLGRTQIAVNFDLPQWVVMQAVPPAVRVYFTGTVETTFVIVPQTVQNIPLTVGFNVGQGRVIFTSFHFERNVTADMLNVLNLLIFEL